MMGREKVRVARALGDLPLIDAAFSGGEISYSKVRAMTRVATPENESFLMQIAEYGTSQHMEFLVKKYALCKRLERIENSYKNDQSAEDSLHEELREEDARYAEYKKDKTLNWFQDELGMYEINQSASCSVENERFLAPQVARRLACDAQITTILEDDKGNILNIVRRSRIIPRAMAHALRIRDGGCLYPGCCQSRYTDAHHTSAAPSNTGPMAARPVWRI